MDKVTVTFLKCLSKKTDCTISIKANKARKAQIRVHIYILCQLKLIYIWPSVPYARSGITSPVNIFLVHYLEIRMVTGNALCVSKDELNHQGYKCMYNSWVGVLHVFSVNFMPFIKNRIYLQFTNCAI